MTGVIKDFGERGRAVDRGTDRVVTRKLHSQEDRGLDLATHAEGAPVTGISAAELTSAIHVGPSYARELLSDELRRGHLVERGGRYVLAREFERRFDVALRALVSPSEPLS